ncbi:MAG: helix-turn-helix domain-containing protein [Clostridiales bacterium]|nr:helix-turn-helix domain-containing protein [Clostridiales bacterium]
MAVFRIDKNKDFTIMSNNHLRNKSLSLKAKGLQSLMLSLPEAWDYSLKGLAKISKDGVESIGTALQELEKHGYLTRRQLRDGKGKYVDLEYTIHEIPAQLDDHPVENSEPGTGKPHSGYPKPGNPDTANPDSGNHAQLNTNSNQIKKDLNTYSSNIHQSIRPDKPDVKDRIDAMDIYRDVLKENIAYDILCSERRYRTEEITELLELMLETVCTTKKTIRVGGDDKPAEVVKSRMMKINQFHIEYVLETLDKNTTDVRNIKSYMLTTLFNAPGTIDNYYKSRVNHDLYGDS